MKRLGAIPYFLVAPAHVMMLLFIIGPAIYVFILSFMQSNYGLDPSFIGFENYKKMFQDRYFWNATWNTFVVVNAIVYLELFIALVLSMVLPPPSLTCRIIVSALILPYAVSEVVGVLMIKYMFDPGVGVISYWLNSLGLNGLEWTINPRDALTLVVLLSVWLHMPFTFLIIYTAKLGLPADVYEASKIDGANTWQRFRHVTIPLLMPAIMIAIVFRYIFAFRLFPEVWLLTQGGPARQTEVLGVYLYKSAFRYYDFGLASATAWAMALLSLLVAMGYLQNMHRKMFVHAE